MLAGATAQDIISTKTYPCEIMLRELACKLPADVYAQLDSSPDGLTEAEAAERLELHGENALVATKARTWMKTVSDAFCNYYNTLLLGVAIVSIVLPDRDWQLFIIIGVTVVGPGIISFIQELKTATAALNNPEELLPNVRVQRHVKGIDSSTIEVDRKHLVCGDVFAISPGDVIPADSILVFSSNLSVSQSRSVESRTRHV